MSTQFARTRPTLTPEKLAGLDVALAKEILSPGKEAAVFALLELSKQLAEARSPSVSSFTLSGMIPAYK
jgi:hypothetical protein